MKIHHFINGKIITDSNGVQRPQTVFQHITGADSMPLSFNQIYEQAGTFQSSGGTTVMTADTPGSKTAKP